MHVLVFSDGVPRRPGEVAGSLGESARRWAAWGHRVSIVHPVPGPADGAPPWVLRPVVDGVARVPVLPSRAAGLAGSLLTFLAILRAGLRAARPDLSLIHI